MPGDITKLLEEWRAGDAQAGEQIIARTYEELRRVARGYASRERPGHTLQATALLHEAYLRLLRKGPGSADNRQAFFRLMAAEMRHRLIDRARRRLSAKRGGGIIHEPVDTSVLVQPRGNSDELEATFARLDRALNELSDRFPRAARVVQLRFICGLTTDETSAHLELSSGTVKREWTFARAWLAAALQPDSPTRLP